MYKVLVVDDEPLMLEGWKTMVDWQACGYELSGTATDGEEALALIRACDPELVITDIRMPVLDGIGLIRAMKEMGCGAKTIIVSAYSEFAYAQKALRYQVDRYVLKPLLTEEIHSLLLDMAASLEDRRLTEASASKMQADAAADAIVGLLGNGGPAAVDMATRLLGVNERTRFRLMLADSVGGSDESEPGGNLPIALMKTLTEALIMDGVRAWAFEESPGLAGLLIIDNDLNEEQFEAWLEEALVKKGWPPRELALYCSETSIGLMTVPDLYRQALEIRSRALLGSHAGIHSYRARKAAGQWCLEDMTAYVGALLQAIETNDPAGIDRSVDELARLFDRTGAQEGWKIAVRHIRGELLRRYAELGADHREAADWLHQLLDGTESADTASWTRTSLKRLSMKATEQFAVKETSVRANGSAITEAVEYLKQHYRGKIRLQELAGRFHLNPTYFGQQFKRETGHSFHDYIHRLRVDEACKMLRRTDMLVSEIASALGYHDTEYFTAKFKALSGELPSSYKYKRQG
ncbi:response regulator transcription factor [Paenibacillus sacheonensis]|uniref:Response regulator n=1 Tax=Paenibacillus sacheonensis TaxID=742054 RepID=A0A7X5C0Q6_9BACL|nr:response regulator [Paenibacillus sacheonensis]MBM7566077.1 two-component system response regulator YesN [Paenibacillus sacheonensis]NBC68614.1 response regulator [Paenibacillus sacheonensis]